MEYFRDSGFEKVALVSGNNSAGLIAPTPPANQSVYLLGIMASGTTILREGSATGPIIMYVSQGNFNFPATIRVSNNSGVYSTVGNTSAIYYIE